MLCFFPLRIQAADNCKKAFENCLLSPAGVNWQGLVYCTIGYIWCVTWIAE
jgi:hypothetical protein